jgi:hypothetical protein
MKEVTIFINEHLEKNDISINNFNKIEVIFSKDGGTFGASLETFMNLCKNNSSWDFMVITPKLIPVKIGEIKFEKDWGNLNQEEKIYMMNYLTRYCSELLLRSGNYNWIYNYFYFLESINNQQKLETISFN